MNTDSADLSDKELFDALYEAYRQLPENNINPQDRLTVWRRIFPLTEEIQRRYPVPDYRPEN